MGVFDLSHNDFCIHLKHTIFPLFLEVIRGSKKFKLMKG